MTNEIDWALLRSPFNPKEVDFRIQTTFQKDGKTKAIVVAYIDARVVQDRLDAVLGPDGWSFEWEPLITTASAVIAAKGTLTIAGVSKSDVGDAGKTEPTKATVSDCLKRTAVQWGVGRYIYALPIMYADVEQRGAQEVLARGELDRLRAALPRPQEAATVANEEARAADGAQERRQAAQQPRQPRPVPAAVSRAMEAASQPLSAGEQAKLLERICNVNNFTKFSEADAWLNQHVRQTADPRGAIGAANLNKGTATITAAEASIVREKLEKMPLGSAVRP